MADNKLNATQLWWLQCLAKNENPWKARRAKDADADASETMLALRRRELIDADGRITDAGKRAVRLGGQL